MALLFVFAHIKITYLWCSTCEVQSNTNNLQRECSTSKIKKEKDFEASENRYCKATKSYIIQKLLCNYLQT